LADTFIHAQSWPRAVDIRSNESMLNELLDGAADSMENEAEEIPSSVACVCVLKTGPIEMKARSCTKMLKTNIEI